MKNFRITETILFASYTGTALVWGIYRSAVTDLMLLLRMSLYSSAFTKLFSPCSRRNGFSPEKNGANSSAQLKTRKVVCFQQEPFRCISSKRVKAPPLSCTLGNFCLTQRKSHTWIYSCTHVAHAHACVSKPLYLSTDTTHQRAPLVH